MDILLVRKADGLVKLLVYRKKSHTDQYLNFASHHPLHHKLGVIRTLLDRKDTIVTEDEDKKAEEEHIREALKRCGYPEWSVKKVQEKMEEKQGKTKRRDKQQHKEKMKGMVVIPYVKGLSEAVTRVFRKHRITTAMRPYRTLRQLLVHPKDKTPKEKTCEVVYRIPCKSCDAVYIGETGRSLGTRLEEHRKDTNSKIDKKYTRSSRVQSTSEVNKSAITDHVSQENHIIDWEGVKVMDRESQRSVRRVKEAIQIRRHTNNMNRDEGAYQLSHTYDCLVARSCDQQSQQ